MKASKTWLSAAFVASTFLFSIDARAIAITTISYINTPLNFEWQLRVNTQGAGANYDWKIGDWKLSLRVTTQNRPVDVNPLNDWMNVYVFGQHIVPPHAGEGAGIIWPNQTPPAPGTDLISGQIAQWTGMKVSDFGIGGNIPTVTQFVNHALHFDAYTLGWTPISTTSGTVIGDITFSGYHTTDEPQPPFEPAPMPISGTSPLLLLGLFAILIEKLRVSPLAWKRENA
jgi:hypothetical protein